MFTISEGSGGVTGAASFQPPPRFVCWEVSPTPDQVEVMT